MQRLVAKDKEPITPFIAKVRPLAHPVSVRPPSPGSPLQAAPCPYVVRDSHLGHQLLLPPANWCPIFAFRTTHAVRPVGLLLVSSR